MQQDTDFTSFSVLEEYCI